MQKLVQLLKLIVGQNVHRVNDDGPCALARISRPSFNNAVDDWNKKCEGLTGARTGGHHVALPVLRLGQGLQLVYVQMQVRRLAFCFTCLKDVCACCVKYALLCQLLNGAAALAIGIDLDQWLGPVTTTGLFFFDLYKDVLCGNLGETAGNRTVFGNEPAAKTENVIHAYVPERLASISLLDTLATL